MLGKVVKIQRADESPKVSKTLKENIVDKWSELRSGNGLATLVPQDEIWKEFWLYASDTKYWCPRLCAIKSFFALGSSVDAEGLWNMSYGKAVHLVFQRYALPSLNNELIGAWKRYVPVYNEDNIFRLERSGYSCEIDDGESREIVRGWGIRPKGKYWEYDESKVRMLKYRIVVKLDAILNIDRLEVFELKTEKERARDDLDPRLGGKAREDHVKQVLLGMWATNIRHARLVYKFKESQSFKNSLLEQEIEYDEDEINRLKFSASKCVKAVEICDDFKSKSKFDIEKNSYFDSDDDFNIWLNKRFKRMSECQKKSEGKPKYCVGRDICFPKGYRKMEK